MRLPTNSSALIVTVAVVSLLLTPPVLSQASGKATSSAELVFRRTHPDASPTDKLHPLVLPDGRLVLSVADTVYMLDAEGKLLWKYSTPLGELLTSEPGFNPEQNEIAVVGFDLLFVRLDANTGKAKWKADMNGRATLARVAAYGKGYLVVADMGGYRENEKADGVKQLSPDGLEYWGESERDSWFIDFPIGAELVVDGKKIYALRHVRGEVRLRRLFPPTVRDLSKAK